MTSGRRDRRLDREILYFILFTLRRGGREGEGRVKGCSLYASRRSAQLEILERHEGVRDICVWIEDVKKAELPLHDF